MIEFDDFEDVGMMPRGHLQCLKEKSELWTPSRGLLSQIRALKSGSIL